MPVIASEGKYDHFSDVFKMNDTPERFEFHTQVVTANETGTPTYVVGTVLGKVTATGKYKIAVETAVDGSKVPAAIVAYNSFGAVAPVTLVAATDTKFVVVNRGKIIVAKEALKLDATYNDATKLAAAYDALIALGIFPETAI